MTSRAELRATLAEKDPEALRLVLHASGVSASSPFGAFASPASPSGMASDEGTAAALAERITDAIWWNYATPLGYVADRANFEQIVQHLAGRLGVADRVDPSLPVGEQVRRFTEALVDTLPEGRGIGLDALREDARNRLDPALGPSLGLGTGAAGSFGMRWGTGRLLALLRTPIGRLLPLLPWVGPWIGAIRTGAGAVFVVSGPLGIAHTVLSVNASLGTNYRKLVPLVLGVGALK